MTKGILTTLAVMLICTVIPIANVLLAPFGPFIGAYYGIRSVNAGDQTPLLAATIFGCVVGAVSALILVIIALILTLAFLEDRRYVILTWIAVAVFSAYVAGMSTLGGLYRLMKTQSAVAAAPTVEAG